MLDPLKNQPIEHYRIQKYPGLLIWEDITVGRLQSDYDVSVYMKIVQLPTALYFFESLGPVVPKMGSVPRTSADE